MYKKCIKQVLTQPGYITVPCQNSWKHFFMYTSQNASKECLKKNAPKKKMYQRRKCIKENNVPKNVSNSVKEKNVSKKLPAK